MNNSTLSSNQVAYLQRAMRDGEGRIEIGELARGLGKQKGNVIRKLEKSFSATELFKMKNMEISTTYKTGLGAVREVATYMLDYKTAGALAMSYDLQLGVHVLTILEEALKGLDESVAFAGKVLASITTAEAKEAAMEHVAYLQELRKKTSCLQYRGGASENEDRSVALRRIKKRNPTALIG